MVHQLLSLLYRYTSTILQDAEVSSSAEVEVTNLPDMLHWLQRGVVQAYYDTAGRPGAGLDVEDVMLAVQAREAFTFTGPPPKHVSFLG